MTNIIEDFDELEIFEDMKKPRVGIVGEILVKFHPTANNDLVNLLEREGAEVVVPDLMGFGLYCCYNATQKEKYLGGTKKGRMIANLVLKAIEYYQKPMLKALEKSKRFDCPESIHTIGEYAKKVVSLCNQTGEGWFLTAELIQLITMVCQILCVHSLLVVCQTMWWAKGLSKNCGNNIPFPILLPLTIILVQVKSIS